MIVCVCGGRDYYDIARLYRTLDAVNRETPISQLVQGGQAQFDKDLGVYIGADFLADSWAWKRGVARREFKARWIEFGPSAGPRRNKEMAEQSGMALCIAFPRANGEWGSGTLNMISHAERLGVSVRRIPNDEDDT